VSVWNQHPGQTISTFRTIQRRPDGVMTSFTSHAVGPVHRRRRTCKWLLAALSAFPAGALLYGSLILLAEPFLWIKAVPRPVDAIVVLGGDGPRRAGRAAQLYKEGFAPRVFVIGDGDCMHIALAMINAGVRASAIDVECKSSSTWENALFSAPIVAQAHIGSAIIVTSWFHTRRALASFQTVSPTIAWRPVATPPDASFINLAMNRDGWAVVLEYLKIIGYALKYDLNPLGTISPEQENPRDGGRTAKISIVNRSI
jgi:uncharacterized SAM-binding protein YcdF (DUF218 family)